MSPGKKTPPWTLPPDMAELVEAGEREAIREILEIFLEDTHRKLVELGAAIARGDAAALPKLSHGFKGGSAQIGAARLAQIAGEWENSGRPAEDWRLMQAEFETEFGQVEAHIRSHPIFRLR